jgi:hypothetical protein
MSRKLKNSQPENDLFRKAHLEIERAATGEQAGDDSLKIVLASETPVPVFDIARGRVINEVMLMSGGSWPNQFPMLNTHNRNDAASGLGSVRDIRREGDQLIGRPAFSRRNHAQEVRQDVIDGHITDASIGARRLESVWIDRGQSRVIDGKTFEGPVRVVTKWRAHEASIVLVGADPTSKFSTAQRAYFDPEGLEAETVNDQFRAFLVERGMPADLDDTAALDWAQKNWVPGKAQVPAIERNDDGDEVPAKPVKKAKAKPAVEEDPINRAAEIRAQCKAVGLDSDFALDCIERDLDDLELKDEIIRVLSDRTKKNGIKASVNIEHTGSEKVKVHDALRDGLLQRAFEGSGLDLPEDFKPAAGAEEFKHRSLVEIGRTLMARNGENINVPDATVALRLLGEREDGYIERAEGPFYNVSGMFKNVTLDVATNTLRASYNEVPGSYQIYAKRGPDVQDFKEVRRSILGEFPDPEVLPENEEINDTTYKDSGEGYKVDVYASIFSVSLQAILNNRLNAFSDAPAKQGRAFQRKINKLVLGVLTGNEALSDGVALFHATHGNLGTQGVISTITLNEGYQKLLEQKGLDGKTIVGVAPRYCLFSPKQAGDALQFFTSAGLALTNHNSAVQNIYGPGGVRGGLIPIIEPQLTAWDADSWFLIAGQNDADTVEYAFLSGFATPQVLQESSFNRLGLRYRIVQAVGAKAIDHRGLFWNTGA